MRGLIGFVCLPLFTNLNEIQTNFGNIHPIYGKIHVRNSGHDHIHSDDNAPGDDDRVNDIHDSHVHIPRGIRRDIRLHTPGRDHTRPRVCDGDGHARDDGEARDGGQAHDGG